MSGFNLSALAVRERAVTLFLIIAISAAGLVAFFRLGRAEDPTFTVKALTVVAVWPGATAQQMQDLVAEPLEKRLQELRYYDNVTTSARPGQVLMTLTLLDETPDSAMPEEFYQARKKLGDEAGKLPKGVIGPIINDEYSEVTFALYALKAPGLPPRVLTRQTEAIRERLLHVPGVKKVDIVGERSERIFVDFAYTRLATLGVTANDLFEALRKQNMLAAAGSIETKGPQLFVRLDGAYDDLQQVRDTPISAAGRTFKLSDVADVRRGYEDPPTFLVRHEGENAQLLGIVMQPTWNGLELGKALAAEQQKIAADLPTGFEFSKVSDQAVNIQDAVGEFMLKFCVALLVVMIVALLSLGWRVGIVVAAAVPLTLAAVFVVMLATDRQFDRITLGALILALGLLVDDAIISIEIMVVKMEEGWDRVKAAAYAWSHTAAPMLSGTIVTIIGLMPIGFAQSSAGEYAGNVFWIVGIALIVSWLVAVAFTPYMGVILLPKIEGKPGGIEAIYDTPTYRKFRSLVSWGINHRWIVSVGVIALFIASVLGMGLVNKQFFPGSDRPELLIEVTTPQGTAIETTSHASAEVEAWLGQQPEAKVVTAYIGAGAPRFFLSYNPELPNPNFAKIIVLTPDDKSRDRLRDRLRVRVADGLAPAARVRVSQLVFGPYAPWPVAFRVTGPDLTRVRSIAGQLEQIMRANPNLRTVNADWGDKTPTAHFVLDQDRLRLLGLSPDDAAEQLQFLLTGYSVTQVREDIRTVEVVARSGGQARLDPAKLGSFTLSGPEGRRIPLGQVGRVEARDEDPILIRRDRLPTITVQGDIDESKQPPDVSIQIEQKMKPILAALPAEYQIQAGGSIEQANKANKALIVVFPLMLVLMLTTVMIQVRSFPSMVMVLMTAPLGLIGAVPMLLIFGQPFGFCAILGVIGLAGILMRNTLILIGQIHTNEQDGMDPYTAVVEATVHRVRPVMLTAMAAVLAFIPLTFNIFWGPMAYCLIGGTAIGTLLILIFLPAVYAAWYRLKPPQNKPAAEPTLPENAENASGDS